MARSLLGTKFLKTISVLMKALSHKSVLSILNFSIVSQSMLSFFDLYYFHNVALFFLIYSFCFFSTLYYLLNLVLLFNNLVLFFNLVLKNALARHTFLLVVFFRFLLCCFCEVTLCC